MTISKGNFETLLPIFAYIFSYVQFTQCQGKQNARVVCKMYLLYMHITKNEKSLINLYLSFLPIYFFNGIYSVNVCQSRYIISLSGFYKIFSFFSPLLLFCYFLAFLNINFFIDHIHTVRIVKLNNNALK